ncbi:hypothetical protein HOLleu_09400 [Holothuria leucospilota]|uniref:Uncharacterized protein n=1 Tax=Holothuria leucospilota TaxID=206669 RepID=A0A9Q1CCU5_HOLLE|nr:hypothetical protein HOLleu_09400 [Holothuria leucospilota]
MAEPGPEPYAFEPVLWQPRPNARVARPNNSDEELEEEAERLPRRTNNLNWCVCQVHCMIMATERECLCCGEVEECLNLMDAHTSCITESQAFQSAGLTEASLKAAIVLMRYTKGL